MSAWREPPEPPRVLATDGAPSRAGRVAQLSISAGGVPKLAVERAAVRATGVAGDRQRNLKYHGGPQRAVCLFSAELIEALRAEGHPIGPGTTGENLTLAGVDWALVVPGARLRVGDAELEVTSFTPPCRTIVKSFLDGRPSRISQKSQPGWSRVYARVLSEGDVWRDCMVSVLR